MKQRTTLVQNARILAVAAALAGSAWGCGGGGNDSTGAGGMSGAGGSTGTACDAEVQVFSKHSCSTMTACHDINGAAANFDMASSDWETHLVGVMPKGGGTIASLCANEGMPYLVADSVPATGLFLRKLAIGGGVPCGVQMPDLPPALSASDKACIQSWANALTKPN